MQEPRRGGSEELAQTTQLYLDCYIALELLHCTYDEYIQRTPRLERLAHQLYVMLKSAKEEYAQEEAERQAEMDHQSNAMMHSGRM